MFKIVLMALSIILLIFPLTLSANPGQPWSQSWTPKLEGIFQDSHLYLYQAEKKLWARYHLVLRDEQLLSLSSKEAQVLLERAFEEAPRRAEFESPWVLLLAAGDEELVFGRIHLSPSQAPRTDLSMFRISQARLKLVHEVREEALARSNSILDGFLGFLKRTFDPDEDQEPAPPRSRPLNPGEMEF